jgi:signal transduction histidine kinase
MSTALSSQQMPVGFARGRQTNRIAVIGVSFSEAPRPDGSKHISQIPPDDHLDPFNAAFTSGILYAAQVTRFNFIWHYWRRPYTAADLVDCLFPKQADAAVILAPRESHLPLLDVLNEREVPHVTAGVRLSDPREPWVVANNREIVAELVGYLAGLGHQRIAHLAGPSDVNDNTERRAGYLKGLEQAGLPLDPGIIVESGADVFVGPSEERIVSLLSGPQHPTAVVCHSDETAVAVLKVAWDIGLKVPEDLAVVACDETDQAAQAIPRITGIRQPVELIAGQAFYLAACAAAGQEPRTAGWQLVLPAEIVVRESCGARGGVAQPSPAPSESHLTADQKAHVYRLEAINEELKKLLYVASHDLRSPLITIEGYASSVERKYADMLDEAGRKKLTRVRESAQSMSDLIETLLAISRSHNQPLSFEQVPVQELVETVIQDLEGPIADARAQVTVAPDLPAVAADWTALHRVFMNLVTNAIKYCGEEPPRIRVGWRPAAEEHEFFVQDNGIGIPAKYHQKVFQLFWRAPESAADGAGIGLTTVRGIVLRHGGRVWIESEEGKGTTFRLTLPRRGMTHGSHSTDHEDS